MADTTAQPDFRTHAETTVKSLTEAVNNPDIQAGSKRVYEELTANDDFQSKLTREEQREHDKLATALLVKAGIIPDIAEAAFLGQAQLKDGVQSFSKTEAEAKEFIATMSGSGLGATLARNVISRYDGLRDKDKADGKNGSNSDKVTVKDVETSRKESAAKRAPAETTSTEIDAARALTTDATPALITDAAPASTTDAAPASTTDAAPPETTDAAPPETTDSAVVADATLEPVTEQAPVVDPRAEQAKQELTAKFKDDLNRFEKLPAETNLKPGQTLFSLAQTSLKARAEITGEKVDSKAVYHELNRIMVANGFKPANLEGKDRISSKDLPKSWNSISNRDTLNLYPEADVAKFEKAIELKDSQLGQVLKSEGLVTDSQISAAKAIQDKQVAEQKAAGVASPKAEMIGKVLTKMPGSKLTEADADAAFAVQKDLRATMAQELETRAKNRQKTSQRR